MRYTFDVDTVAGAEYFARVTDYSLREILTSYGEHLDSGASDDIYTFCYEILGVPNEEGSPN